MSKGIVLVGGGTGFIGSHLCTILRNKKYDVKVISRMPGPKRMTWHDLQEIGIPAGTKAVVNLAGQNVLDATRRWSAGFKQNVWNSRVNTTLLLSQAIADAADTPPVFVTISGCGIYKPSFHNVYSEDWRVGDDFDFLSKLCIEWEKAAKLPPAVNCRVVTIRSGVVLGRDGGMIKQLYLPFYLGLGGPVGDGDQWLPWIHVGDLTRLLAFAIETDGLKGILNGVAPQPCTNRQFSEAFATALGRPAVIPLPAFILNIIFHKERAKMITEGQSVIPRRTLSLGFKYVFPDITAACGELVNTPNKKNISYQSG